MHDPATADKGVSNRNLGFFKPKKLHLFAVITVICVSIVTFLPSSFSNTWNGTVIVNFLLIAVMLLSLFFMIIDLFNKEDSE